MRQTSTCLWCDPFDPPCQRVPAQSPDKAGRPPHVNAPVGRKTFALAGLDQAFHHR